LPSTTDANETTFPSSLQPKHFGIRSLDNREAETPKLAKLKEQQHGWVIATVVLLFTRSIGLFASLKEEHRVSGKNLVFLFLTRNCCSAKNQSEQQLL
jgi:hypothetical protein